MNFNPNAMMQKQVERMISQRFGSVDNMMNDMSKFAGNNPTLKNALDLSALPQVQLHLRKYIRLTKKATSP